MADINRQLQDYLAQSKSSCTKTSSTNTILDLSFEEPVQGSWFGRWSRPWTGNRTGSTSSLNSSGSHVFGWPFLTEPDPCLPGMSKGQRLVAFVVCLLLSGFCFGLSALYAPLLLLYARKFSLLWSLGSIFAIASVAILRGPSRLAATLPTSPGAAVYLCALAGTLYAALKLRSTVLTAVGAAVQVTVIAGYVMTLLPGGSAGFRFIGGLAASAVKKTVTGKAMPI
ncbi:vesicle transport protein SFT2C [Gouania willdenowi]|uniref:Vesicle transport protein n=1 Tax=Gouania willdenowi TaxID=441366 RepID=A0A8C5DH77_GOUWI|nr:vesicle transport protein SFT2C [Gouania willdenowi]